jgi:alcohol dehydrogenase (cytochrome c)
MTHRLAGQALAVALSCIAGWAQAQTLADLRSDAATASNVSTYGMGWSQQRHAALSQITPANVGSLQAVWNLSLDNSANASSQPLVIGGVMYVASHSHTIAVDALTGRQKWKTAIELPADIGGYLCCGIQSRGFAALDGVLYRTTIDAHVLAINMADGKTLWKKKPMRR